jgi:hypothetical protein
LPVSSDFLQESITGLPHPVALRQQTLPARPGGRARRAALEDDAAKVRLMDPLVLGL